MFQHFCPSAQLTIAYTPLHFLYPFIDLKLLPAKGVIGIKMVGEAKERGYGTFTVSSTSQLSDGGV